MKFLIIWELDIARLRPEIVNSLMRMPEYAEKLREQGKLVARYHIVGKHGGAWIYDVSSNEELEQLLALSPVYNNARYEVHVLAEMETPASIMQPMEGATGG
ncbi:MAG TPA: muconolactone Delta-isomerase family protein [Blastocatellia bacterium]|nr:muconolactone Delta-isomerase family protein [Blastocatellia bacterium]